MPSTALARLPALILRSRFNDRSSRIPACGQELRAVCGSDRRIRRDATRLA